MGFSGDIFTWQRGKIRERLDRGVSNAPWNELFPNARLVNGEMTKSDHRPLIVDTESQPVQVDRSQQGGRRLEARWLKEETVEEIVKAAWARAAASGEGPTLMQKTRQVHEDLHSWDYKVLKGLVNRIKNYKRN